MPAVKTKPLSSFNTHNADSVMELQANKHVLWNVQVFFKHIKPKVHSGLFSNRTLWTNRGILFLVWGQCWTRSLVPNNTVHTGEALDWTSGKNLQLSSETKQHEGESKFCSLYRLFLNTATSCTWHLFIFIYIFRKHYLKVKTKQTKLGSEWWVKVGSQCLPVSHPSPSKSTALQ